MVDDEQGQSWRGAVAQASFTIYGPTVPPPRSLWAGGFGYSGHRPDHIGVVADIDGTEVTVDTASPERVLPAGLDQRRRVADAIWHHLLAEETAIELPLRLEIVSEDQNISVGGIATTFSGVRVVGSASWSGSATIGDVVVTITTTDPAVVSAIEPIDPADLPEESHGDLME